MAPLNTKAVVALFIGAATALLFSCTKDAKIVTAPPPVQQPLPAIVSFSTHIVPVFNTYCNNTSGCHTAVAPAAGLNLTPASAYGSLFSKHEIDTASAMGSNLYIEITNGAMPKYPNSPLTSYNQQLILKWIQQKAKNN